MNAKNQETIIGLLFSEYNLLTVIKICQEIGDETKEIWQEKIRQTKTSELLHSFFYIPDKDKIVNKEIFEVLLPKLKKLSDLITLYTLTQKDEEQSGRCFAKISEYRGNIHLWESCYYTTNLDQKLKRVIAQKIAALAETKNDIISALQKGGIVSENRIAAAIEKEKFAADELLDAYFLFEKLGYKKLAKVISEDIKAIDNLETWEKMVSKHINQIDTVVKIQIVKKQIRLMIEKIYSQDYYSLCVLYWYLYYCGITDEVEVSFKSMLEKKISACKPDIKIYIQTLQKISKLTRKHRPSNCYSDNSYKEMVVYGIETATLNQAANLTELIEVVTDRHIHYFSNLNCSQKLERKSYDCAVKIAAETNFDELLTAIRSEPIKKLKGGITASFRAALIEQAIKKADTLERFKKLIPHMDLEQLHSLHKQVALKIISSFQ